MLFARCSSCAVVGLLLLAVFYHRPSCQSPFFDTDLRLAEFAARCLRYTAHILLMTACYSLLPFCCSLLAIGCFSRCLVLVSRYSPACCSLRITYYTLPVIPCSLLTAQLSLLSSRLVSSADRFTSSRIVHPCSRWFIRFSER